MDKDRIAGSAKDFAGEVEGTAGGIAADAGSQAAAQVREATGTAQNLYGQAKDTARETADAAVSYAKDACENSVPRRAISDKVGLGAFGHSQTLRGKGLKRPPGAFDYVAAVP